MFTDYILPVLNEVLGTFGSLIIVIIGAFVIYGLKLGLKKIGINVNETQMNQINSVIISVIKSLYGKYTQTIKEMSTTGKLTTEQALIIRDRAIEDVKALLSTEQVQLLLKKYNVETVDEIMNVLIDEILLDIKKEYPAIDKSEAVEESDGSEEKVASVSPRPCGSSFICGNCPVRENCQLIKF